MSYWKSRGFSTLLALAVVAPLILLGLNMWVAVVIAMVIATVVTTLINVRITVAASGG